MQAAIKPTIKKVKNVWYLQKKKIMGLNLEQNCRFVKEEIKS